MDFQTNTITEDLGNLVVESTVVHTETHIVDTVTVEQSQQDEQKEADDEANGEAGEDAPNEPPDNDEDGDKDESEQIASEAATFQPSTMEHNESEIFENYSSITASALESL